MNKVVENLDYIKQQNNQLLVELREIQRKVPNKQEFQQLNYLLENQKPKQAKELLQKIEKQVENLEQVIETVKKIVEG